MFFSPLLQGAGQLLQVQSGAVSGALVHQVPWTRQPQGAVAVDWSNPLTRGLVNAYNFATSNRDIANSVQGAVTDVNTVGVGFSGQLRGLSTNNSLRSISDPTGKLLTTGACTHLAIVRLTAVDNPWGGVFSVSDASSNAVIGFQRRNNLDSVAIFRANTGEMQFSTTITSLTDGGIKVLGLRFTGAGTDSCSFFVNGIAQTATNAGSATATSASGAVSLRAMGERSASATTNSNGNYFGHFAWNRALSDNEIKSISANPWQIFKPVTRTIALSGAVVQLLRPDGDISSGAWLPSTGSDLYAMLDETTADDGDYIYTTSTSTAEVSLTNAGDPAVSTGHIIRYRAKGTGTLTVKLMQGTTTIATHVPTLTTSYQTFTFTLSGAEADSITDYSNLRLQFISS